MATKINPVTVLGVTVKPRTIRAEIMFRLLSAHMLNFTSVDLSDIQPHQNQNLHVLASWKWIEACRGGGWRLTEDGLAALKVQYKKFFASDELKQEGKKPMICEKHGIEMEYIGEGSYIGQDIWECYLCNAEDADRLEMAGYEVLEALPDTRDVDTSHPFYLAERGDIMPWEVEDYMDKRDDSDIGDIPF